MHADFSESLKQYKARADDLVEQSLFRRATGYECDEVDIRVVNGEVVQTPLRRIYPPDTTACIFWLKNRQPDQWRAQDKDETPGDKSDTLKKLADNLPD